MVTRSYFSDQTDTELTMKSLANIQIDFNHEREYKPIVGRPIDRFKYLKFKKNVVGIDFSQTDINQTSSYI